MFWDNAYTPTQNIEELLQKEDLTLEELLDDDDILQECKTQKRVLVQYLTRPDIIKHLIELIITEPPENKSITQRFKHSNMACEILTFGLPSLEERLVEEPTILDTLYSFLEQKPPLNPLLSSFFSKTFTMLISKKSEQDWFLYQKMCLQVLEFIKSRGNFLDLILNHFGTPVIMDLLLQIIKEVQGGALKKSLYEWLTEQKLVERLINLLGQPEESEKHNNISEFLCELIRHGRSMRQTEQDCDSFEPTFIGSNPLLQVIEDENATRLLLDVILKEPIRETSIVTGIIIVLTLVDESIIDEPASDKALQMMIDKEKENHVKIVSTVIRTIAPRINEFHEILLNPPVKTNYIMSSTIKPNQPFGLTRLQICRLFTVLLRTGNSDIINTISSTEFFNTLLKLFKQYSWNNFLHSEVEKCLEYVFAAFNESQTEGSWELKPSALQIYVIVNCKIVPKLIDCWMHNREIQSSKNGKRLGYMGHLIRILEKITMCISSSDHLGALIVSNLTEKELDDWKIINDKDCGELPKELDTQRKLLANCNAYEDAVYGVSLPKDFHNENFNAEFFNNPESHLPDNVDDQITPDEIALNLRQLKVWGNTDLEENFDDEFLDYDRYGNNHKIEGNRLNMANNPWDANPFTDIPSGNSTSSVGGWADFTSNNFADFDSHFSSFANDLGDKMQQSPSNCRFLIEKSDSNANAEKIPFSNSQDYDINFKNAKNVDMNNEIQKDNDEEEDNNEDEKIAEKIISENSDDMKTDLNYFIAVELDKENGDMHLITENNETPILGNGTIEEEETDQEQKNENDKITNPIDSITNNIDNVVCHANGNQDDTKEAIKEVTIPDNSNVQKNGPI